MSNEDNENLERRNIDLTGIVEGPIELEVGDRHDRELFGSRDDILAMRILASDFEIPSLEDETIVEFAINETGLYVAEIRFHVDDPERTHDKLTLAFESGNRPGLVRWRPGNLRTWFRPERVLDPETSYGFYFWVDGEMLRHLGDDQILRLVLGRVYRERVDDGWEFGAGEPREIVLPRLYGRVHLKPPRPRQVEALPDANPQAEPRTVLTREVIHYQVRVNFPRLTGRMRPYEFKAEFRVPESQGVLNADLGGMLLINGRWVDQQNLSSSGTYDFLASPATEFSEDRNHGRRRAFPIEEDWELFKDKGLLFALDDSPTVEVREMFYLAGGDEPPDYYVVELEELTLSTVPDEGDGPFWLKFNNAAALAWEEEQERDPDNDFADPRPVMRELVQMVDTRFPIARSGDNARRIRPHSPLFALPAADLEGKDALAIVANPHYFHQMSVWEEAVFIFNTTETVDVIEALVEQDALGLALAIAEWIRTASQAENPDLYRTFGEGFLATDSNRGWAACNAPDRYPVEGASSGHISHQEISGSDGRNVATVSAIEPGHENERTYSSSLKVRKIPGVWVDGAEIEIQRVKTNQDFNGHIKVLFGVIGHDGGRTIVTNQGLDLQEAALNTPFSYWSSRVAERGPFNIRSGAAREIDFVPIDFINPDRDPEGLWEQMRHTFGAWAGLQIQLALVEIEEMAGHGDLGPDVVEAIHYIDMAYLTIYPFDKLYDPVFGCLLDNAERQGDWLVLQGTIEPHSEVLDEVELEVRLKVQARDTGLMVRGEVWQGQSE